MAFKYLDNLNAELVSAGQTPYSYYKDVSAALAAAHAGDMVNDMTITDDENAVRITLKNDDDIWTVNVKSNTEITLPSLTRDGYTFQGWKDEATNTTYPTGSSLTVTANVTLAAQWMQNSKPSSAGSSNATLTFATNGGTAINKVTKAKGTTIDLSAYTTTRSGYTFDGWYSDKELTKKVTSVKLDAATTVYAKWTQNAVSHDCPAEKYTDVNTSLWYHEAIDYVLTENMMTGTSETTFAPNANLTRGMIAQVLYNIEGKPAASSSQFTDVVSGEWYANAVNWAADKEIVSGYGDGTFGPNDSITREQMAAILNRYAQVKGYDVSASGSLSAFADAGKVSEWAKASTEWAVGAKLLSGKGGSMLDPTGTATRAEVAQILMSFCENIAK